ncbi:hypothetical protein ENUP19_0079G0014 [Entamoeba nuttalli]|uniref:aspartyl aminopeptidase n=2 Tax=Entamoeba nuttalli TaxID=412467 RepID=K2GJC0_ENTNP|nr:aminopeptidase, putative [Entamoeba nuttalli P19]EKE42866.1 aminopeptidase, putative [Entamoeba nuttalli P19]|eukprot:XP_008854801.1 aminopeptidase, putative [Entamoeba nuttalli P19]
MEEDFLKFLENCSGSAFNAVEHIKQLFLDNNFQLLKENNLWNLEKGKKYFIIRDDATIFAFAIGGKYEIGNGFIIAGAHLDSPSLKLKPNPFKESEELNLVSCETYGGGVWTTWFDRDLGICGRVVVEEEGQFKSIPIVIKEPLYRIATCAPHLDKRYPKGFIIDKETELPAIGLSEKELLELIQERIGNKSIITYDLYLCDIQKPSLLGMNKEFVVGQGLDNLICSYGAIYGMVRSSKDELLEENCNILMSCIYDDEEIGSTNRRGANSVMLPNIMKRIAYCFNDEKGIEERIQIGESKSIVLSTDVGHAAHPNYPDRTDDKHPVYMNHGLVIETNCSQQLLGDSNVFAIMSKLGEEVGVKFQRTVKRQEKGGGGSTIGPKIASHTGLNVIDFGIPLLSMHSIREIGGISDVDSMTRLVAEVMKSFWKYQNSLN